MGVPITPRPMKPMSIATDTSFAGPELFVRGAGGIPKDARLTMVPQPGSLRPREGAAAATLGTMSAYSLSDLLLIFSAFFLAGIVKGVLGLGLPTVAIGLLGLLMPVAQASSLLTVPSLVTNVWQARRGPHLGALLRRLWPMQLGIVIGAFSGTGWMEPQHARLSALLLGGSLVAYGVASLAGLRLPRPAPEHERATGLLAGIATGLVTAATGVFALPLVPYLQALVLDKDEMSQALGISFTVSTAALAVVLAGTGSLDAGMAWQSMLALLPALAGMALGQAQRDKLSQATFRKALFSGLLALGAWLIVRQ